MGQMNRPDAAALLHENYLLDSGASTSTTTDPDTMSISFPVSNFNQPERWKKWLYDEQGAENDVVFDLGSAKRPTVIAVIDTNAEEESDFSSNTSDWYLRASNDATFSTYEDLSYWPIFPQKKGGFRLYIGADEPAGVWYWKVDGESVEANHCMVASDGRILVIGTRVGSDMFTAMLSGDGVIDTNYGTDGYDAVSHTGNPSFEHGIITSDGRSLVASKTTSNMTISMVEDDGSLDTAFDTDGVAQFDFNLETDRGIDAVEQGTGHFVVVGIPRYSGVGRVGAVRVDSTGTETHRVNTLMTGSTAGDDDVVYACAVDSGDNVYIVGGTDASGTRHNFINRYDSTLSLDTGFNTTGKLEYLLTSENGTVGGQQAKCVAVDDNDDVYVFSSVGVNTYGDMMGVAKFDSTGNYQTEFQRVGFRVYDDLPDIDHMSPSRCLIDSSGRLVVSGHAVVGGVTCAYVMRLTADGAPDTSFGDRGVAVFSIGHRPVVFGMFIDDNNKIVLSGTVYLKRDFETVGFVARILASGYPDTTFAPDEVSEPKRYWQLHVGVPDNSVSEIQHIGYVHLGNYLNIRPEPGASIDISSEGNTFKTHENDMVTDKLSTRRAFSFRTKDMTRMEVCSLRDTLEQYGNHTPMVMDAYGRSGETVDQEYGLFYGFLTSTGFFDVRRSSAFGEDVRMKFEESL